MLFFGSNRSAGPSKNTIVEGPPNIQVIAEDIRRTLVDDFEAYFPNLNMETQNDGKIVIKVVDNNTGLNIEIEVRDLNHQATVVPQTPGTPAAPGAPGGMPAGPTPPAGPAGPTSPTTPAGPTPPPPPAGTAGP